MARHAITQRVRDVESLKDFSAEGYAFAPDLSDAHQWVFRRAEKDAR